MPFCYYPDFITIIFIGATVCTSKNNFFEWLDLVATSVNLMKSLVRGVKGQRLKGVYNHMKLEEFAMLRGMLVDKLVVLGEEARAVGISCRTVLEVGAFMQGRFPLAPSGADHDVQLACTAG